VSVRRRRQLLVAVPALAVFLAISFVVARFLTTENRERDLVTELLGAQGRGDAAGVLRRLDGCDAACAARIRAFLPRVSGPGEVKVVRLDSATAYSLGRSEGWTRVVWTHETDGETTRPVVQCVRVRRDRSPLAGRSVSLLRLTAPLPRNEDPC
jgi:hypothetical protein